MTQCCGDGAEECFFERAPDRAVAGTIDNAEFYDLVLQQPQGPACASLGRLGTGQGNQLGLLLAVKNPSNGRHRARLAAQHGLEASSPVVGDESESLNPFELVEAGD